MPMRAESPVEQVCRLVVVAWALGELAAFLLLLLDGS